MTHRDFLLESSDCYLSRKYKTQINIEFFLYIGRSRVDFWELLKKFYYIKDNFCKYQRKVNGLGELRPLGPLDPP